MTKILKSYKFTLDVVVKVSYIYNCLKGQG